MPFPRGVREKVLVAAARSCCLCQKFKGVKVEVHHIIPEPKGGGNDIDNAIALCFDCHADVQHYNPKHPRGTRYSPKELIEHRKRWYETVVRNGILRELPEELIYARHLVCKSFAVIAEICDRNFSNLPLDQVLLHENEVFHFWQQVVQRHGKPIRDTETYGKAYDKVEDIVSAYPECRMVTGALAQQFPSYRTVRVPSPQEIRECTDPITVWLLDHGVPAGELVVILGYLERCGERPLFQEIIRVRPVYGVMLCVKNISDRPLSLAAAKGTVDGTMEIDYRRFQGASDKNSATVRLPSMKIEPGSQVLIPEATVLGTLEKDGDIQFSEPEMSDASEQAQIFGHAGWPDDVVSSFRVIGPFMRIGDVIVEGGTGANIDHPIHSFDPSNVYTIDRFWECGSCPHLYWHDTQKRTWSYGGEILANSSPRSRAVTELKIPPGTDTFCIVELEHEVVKLLDVALVSRQRSHKLLATAREMVKGDFQRFQVPSSTLESRIFIDGFYVPVGPVKRTARGVWNRGDRVASFLGVLNLQR